MSDAIVERELKRRDSVQHRRCACCSADLAQTGIVGTGRFDDGLFCSLDCMAAFNAGKPAPSNPRVSPPQSKKH